MLANEQRNTLPCDFVRCPAYSPTEVEMNAETMRRNADNCLALAENAANTPVRLRYMRMAVAWQDLAENQDWLDGTPRCSPSLQPELHTAA